ncbi:hypothetical protein RJT34_12259 [Clitoria ternatea]|uniref:At2g24240-like C-terminal beta-propeller domain-containing protein n=1 Tax=Clitoria ternatea TaxID=43366 RepID=A0AAN9JNL3_CLITE
MKLSEYSPTMKLSEYSFQKRAEVPDLLRTSELYILPNVSKKLLYREALYYGMLDHVRTAKLSPFNGNRLRLSRSLQGQATGDGTTIRVGPDGGCCVAHGSMVHVYDWMLEEHASLNLDYQRVKFLD